MQTWQCHESVITFICISVMRDIDTLGPVYAAWWNMVQVLKLTSKGE